MLVDRYKLAELILYSAALFLEFWKQYSREITHRWDVTGFTPEEEHPRPEYLEKLKNVEEKSLNFITQTMEPKVSETETFCLRSGKNVLSHHH